MTVLSIDAKAPRNVLLAHRRLRAANEQLGLAKTRLAVLEGQKNVAAEERARLERRRDLAGEIVYNDDLMGANGQFVRSASGLRVAYNRPPPEQAIEAAQAKVAEAQAVVDAVQEVVKAALASPAPTDPIAAADAIGSPFVAAREQTLLGNLYLAGDPIPLAQIRKLPARKLETLLSVRHIYEVAPQEWRGSSSPAGTPSSVGGLDPHSCPNCDRTFGTAQARAGHQRACQA
jgi:hypothetical protein